MQSLSRHRPLVLLVVVVVLISGLGSALWLRRRAEGAPGSATALATGPARTTALAADREATVPVDDHWSVTVPAGGAGTSPATLTVTPVTDLAAPTGRQRSLGAAQLSLSTGQPAEPWTFTYHLDEPLAADQVLYLVDDDADGVAFRAAGGTGPVDDVVAARVHAATMSPDRRTGTVTVDHLSFKQWVADSAGDLTSGLGELFDQRTGAPDCTGTRPPWMSAVTFVDDQNAPLRVCTGSDPQHADIAVVKIANNRGGALLVFAPATPTWAYQSWLGDHVGDWTTNLVVRATATLGIDRSHADRAWLVPSGQQLHLGFSQASLDKAPDPAVVRGLFTPDTVGVGLALRQLSDVIGDVSPQWGYGMLAVCLQGAAADASGGFTAGRAVLVAAELAKCAVEHPKEIVEQIRRKMPAAEWQRVSPQVYRTANAAKTALGRLLAIAEFTYVATDVATTFALDPAALRISLSHDPLDSPTLIDQDGKPIGSPAAGRIRQVYAELKAGNLTLLQRAYASAEPDALPWSQVGPLLSSADVRRGLLRAMRSAPGVGDDVTYNYFQADYGIGFSRVGTLAYVSAPSSAAPPTSASDPYGCLAADRAMSAGEISYAQHPCASHFQDSADPTKIEPDTPATRWALCHGPEDSSDPQYLVDARSRYCH